MIKIEFKNGLTNYYNDTMMDIENKIEELKRHHAKQFENIKNKKKKTLYYIKNESITDTVDSAICNEMKKENNPIKYDLSFNLLYDNKKVYSQNYYVGGQYAGKEIYIIEEVKNHDRV